MESSSRLWKSESVIQDILQSIEKSSQLTLNLLEKRRLKLVGLAQQFMYLFGREKTQELSNATAAPVSSILRVCHLAITAKGYSSRN